jgi:hypothetical protein
MKIGDHLIAKDNISRTIYSMTYHKFSGELLSVSEKNKVYFNKNKKYIITDINDNLITISCGINDNVKFSLVYDGDRGYEYYKNIFFDHRFLKLNKLNNITL